MRSIVVPVLVLAALPIAALSSATVVGGAGVPATLVEGHTVAATLGAAPLVTGSQFFFVGAPVTQATAQASERAFPGARWFNDQYVADPAGSPVGGRSFGSGLAVLVSDAYGRFPCTGALFVANAGASDPRALPWG